MRIKRLVTMVAFVVLVSCGVVGAAEKDALVIAHRGASGHAPENTMAAFEKAVELQADYFELDIQLSKDGYIVVIHDVTLERTTDGRGPVGNYTLEELRKLNAGNGDSFEPIPTLDEVLDRFVGQIGIVIELKSPEKYPGVEEKVADMLKEKGLDNGQANIVLQSFNFNSVKKLSNLVPGVPGGVLVNKYAHLSKSSIAEFATYAAYVNPKYTFVNSKLVKLIHDAGMEIMVWTVNDLPGIKRQLGYGVDGIITNYPDLLTN